MFTIKVSGSRMVQSCCRRTSWPLGASDEYAVRGSYTEEKDSDREQVEKYRPPPGALAEPRLGKEATIMPDSFKTFRDPVLSLYQSAVTEVAKTIDQRARVSCQQAAPVRGDQ